MITGEVSGLVLSGCLRKKSQSCHTKLYPVSRSSVAPGGNQYVGHRGPTLHKKLLSIVIPMCVPARRRVGIAELYTTSSIFTFFPAIPQQK